MIKRVIKLSLTREYGIDYMEMKKEEIRRREWKGNSTRLNVKRGATRISSNEVKAEKGPSARLSTGSSAYTTVYRMRKGYDGKCPHRSRIIEREKLPRLHSTYHSALASPCLSYTFMVLCA
ncbi:hypothetical protein KQX54_004019 [Cotesia glomerata]|uniref:Uncharacterized protein n=1 Tax=Cotesia glomerata TaxID=32391 RepID=A0AAV7I286_COTGL|nr:hypothetical protein KQX54_004019 [Cotesia glomerata]